MVNNPEPKYTSQRMIGGRLATRPTSSTWMYSAKVFGGRGYALFLATVDAIVSYKGLRDWDLPPFEAAILASFIGITQALVGLGMQDAEALSARFSARFFEGDGPLGFFLRCLGSMILMCLAGIYIGDVITNVAAFMGGDVIPERAGDVLKLLLMTILALALTFGDELLHLFVDDLEIGRHRNFAVRQGQIYESQLVSRYQRHYLKNARVQADQHGAEHGQRWRPRDLD